jgi:hypothetical protein
MHPSEWTDDARRLAGVRGREEIRDDGKRLVFRAAVGFDKRARRGPSRARSTGSVRRVSGARRARARLHLHRRAVGDEARAISLKFCM